MEKEQIIKALECCSGSDCRRCPYFGHITCISLMRKDSIALIKQQDEQIFQLENRLKECENGYEGTLHLERNKLHDAEERVKELTEENKMLEAEIQLRNMLISDASNRIEEIRTNTVREMQEKAKAEAYVPKPYGMSKVVDVGTIDHIADEILNENTEE